MSEQTKLGAKENSVTKSPPEPGSISQLTLLLRWAALQIGGSWGLLRCGELPMRGKGVALKVDSSLRISTRPRIA